MMRSATVGRVMHAVDVFAQHDELVAAETRDRVGLADGGLDPSGGFDEELVAHRVAERVVDGLEPVQVDEQHAEHAAVTSDAGERLLEPVGEHHAVRQTGERIVQHLVRELRLEALLFREVANDARDDRREAVDGDRARGDHHREMGSVAAHARGLDLLALGRGVPDRSVLREELLERVLAIRRHDHRDRLPHDLGWRSNRTSPRPPR